MLEREVEKNRKSLAEIAENWGIILGRSILFPRLLCFPRALIPSFCHKLTNSPQHQPGGKNGLTAVLPLLVNLPGSGLRRMSKSGGTRIWFIAFFGASLDSNQEKESGAIRYAIKIKLED